MAKQTINQGTAPTGAGGDTFRSGSEKLQANDNEIYNYLGDGTNLNKLGTAAFKNTGKSLGNVMEVGAFGLGETNQNYPDFDKLETQAAVDAIGSGFYSDSTHIGEMIIVRNAIGTTKLVIGASSYNGGPPQYQLISSHSPARKDFKTAPIYTFRTTQNTTVDANGFLKSASPIVQLFADKIEMNDEAQLQEIVFEKLGVGDYLIKGSSGFAQEGWYIETPKDANGNLLVAVVYAQLENGDISVKTFDYMLNNKGCIVADIEAPLDIHGTRWIDLRLQELPKPEVIHDPEQ